MTCPMSSKSLINDYFQSKKIAAMIIAIIRFKKIFDNNIDAMMFYQFKHLKIT